MFRKVFGNHVAANREEIQVMEGTPQGDDDLADMTSEAPTAPVGKPAVAVVAPRIEAPDPADLATTQRAAALAARAAAAQDQMSQTKSSVRARPATVSTAPATTAPADRQRQEPSSDAAPEAPAKPPAKQSDRTRTRLLGFDADDDDASDPFAKVDDATNAPNRSFAAGWVVIVDGPGRGQHFAIFNGAAMVGRGEGQGICLDFGDMAISRQNHAAIAYDLEDNKFYIGHGGKSNIIRLNNRPLLSTETLSTGDMIRIGETTLRFVALCGEEFQWGALKDD